MYAVKICNNSGKYKEWDPKNAIFDYVDIFGGKHYHTNRRQYVVYRGSIRSISKKFEQ